MSVKTSKRGDTMIEVLFAIAVFALVSVISIVLMNSGVSTIEATLELSMARNEIDSQSEAIRYIHNAYLSEREFTAGNQTYANLWKRIKEKTNDSSDAILDLTVEDCAIRYNSANASQSIFGRKTIIFNTRNIDKLHPNNTIISANESPGKFAATELNPRIIYGSSSSNTDTTLRETYTNLQSAQGIWVIPVKSGTVSSAGQPEFYDFHIYTCWFAPGRGVPTTIGTIMRLYNPELIEVGK